MSVSFTIKDCPREVKAALQFSARLNRRSQNAEAIVWLEERARALRSRPGEAELLRRIQGVKWKTRLAIALPSHRPTVLRPADLPTCRPADLPTCRRTDVPAHRDHHAGSARGSLFRTPRFPYRW